MEKYGLIKSGEKLRDFIFDIFGDKVNISKDKIKYVTPDVKQIDFKENPI